MRKKQSNILFKETIENANKLLNEAIELFDVENHKIAVEKLSTAHKIFLANKDIAQVSVCLSLIGLIKYIDKTEGYYKSLLLLEDSKFLAESVNKHDVIAVNKFAFGQIYYAEKKYQEAILYLNSAIESLDNYPILKIKAIELLNIMNLDLENTNSKFEEKNKTKTEYDQNHKLLLALSKIARTVNAEANIDKLLMTIAEQTKIVLDADRCTLFLYDEKNNELWSKVALGMESEEIRFSANKGFAGYVMKTGEIIRIDDAYNDSRFNKEIDEHTGYKTYNLLCLPMRNIKFEIIGVFQVLNKKNGSFTEADENILLTIGTNASIAIENNLLFSTQQKMLQEQQKLFGGFIDTLAASIDARDKITLGHSNRVRLYSELIANQLGLNKDITEIISKAAMLHDIGKIGIKDAVLQKKGALTNEEYEHIKEHVKITYDILCKTNMSSSFSEIAEIAASHHEKYDGTGYFRGLKGEEIPFGGRILAVSDVYDAITSVRHYRDRMPMKDALNIMIEGKNKHFDGKIIDAFLSLKCDVVTDVLISEFDVKLKTKDRKTLSTINMKEFAEILNKNSLNQEEKKLVDIFNSYYIRQHKTTTI